MKLLIASGQNKDHLYKDNCILRLELCDANCLLQRKADKGNLHFDKGTPHMDRHGLRWSYY